MRASSDTLPLLAELLAEQQRLDTPVARFATARETHAHAGKVELRPQLIPLTAPLPGEQFAFEVDLDACSGCKSCVAACHSLNGLDETETWRDVGLLVSSDRKHPFTQTVTTACHHCADPACLNGCPVLAYEKDPATGIVRHLDDQCIGCSYCVLKCPYDVPKYSARLGIVRKCDMCHGRLTHGEAPACAQACPTQAIRIITVAVDTNATARAGTSGFLPTAPDPSYTQPTTRYITRRTLPENIVPADAAALRPQPPHWPLVFMLTFMPMAVGLSTFGALLGRTNRVTHHVTFWAAAAGIVGLLASVFHLGRPLRAWRIFLGWRTSWLSREAVLFGGWFALAAATPAVPSLAPVSAVVGVAGLICSVMIYADTRRLFWRWPNTTGRFFGSAVVLSLATLFVLQTSALLAVLLAASTIAKLLFEARPLAVLRSDPDELTPARKTALLLTGPLRTANELRAFAGLLGGVFIPLVLLSKPEWAPVAWAALSLSAIGELLERSLFFRAVDAPKMPGLPS